MPWPRSESGWTNPSQLEAMWKARCAEERRVVAFPHRSYSLRAELDAILLSAPPLPKAPMNAALLAGRPASQQPQLPPLPAASRQLAASRRPAEPPSWPHDRPFQPAVKMIDLGHSRSIGEFHRFPFKNRCSPIGFS